MEMQESEEKFGMVIYGGGSQIGGAVVLPLHTSRHTLTAKTT